MFSVLKAFVALVVLVAGVLHRHPVPVPPPVSPVVLPVVAPPVSVQVTVPVAVVPAAVAVPAVGHVRTGPAGPLAGPRVPLRVVPAPTTTAVPAVPAPFTVADLPEPWACIAGYESGSDPSINTGNGYSGMWQDSPGTWLAAGGGAYAAYAWEASLYDQLIVNEQIERMQGWQAWPISSRRCGV